MSSISTFLDNISSAKYGDDVRDSIIGALQQCYADATGNPESVAGVIEDYRLSKDGISTAVESLTGIFNEYSDSGTIFQSAANTTSIDVPNSPSGTNNYVVMANLTLSPGNWLIIYGGQWNVNATGHRWMCLNLQGTGTPTGSRWIIDLVGSSIASVQDIRPMPYTIEEETTFYLWGWQNSGAALTCWPILAAIKIKGIDNSEDASKSLLSGVSWELGSINDDGTLISADTRIRTADYIDISRGRTITFKVADEYKYDYEVYTFDKTRANEQGGGTWVVEERTVTFSDNAQYLKLIIAANDDSTVDLSISSKLSVRYKNLPMNTLLEQVVTNTSDIEDIKNNLTTNETTLTTLSEQITTNTTDIAELKDRADEIDTFTNDLSLGVDFETGLARLYVNDEPIGEAVRVADEERMQTLVDDWLDSHPEATTTVQDGSITEVKLASEVSSKFTDLHDEILSKNAERIQEIAVERSRIDALSTLPEGTSILDAEVMDIRLGADDVTYGSAGTAVRTQVTNLQNQIANLTTQFNGFFEHGYWTPHLYDYTTMLRDMGVNKGQYIRIGRFVIYWLNSNECNFSNVSTMVQIRNFSRFEYDYVFIIGGTFYSAGISANSGGNVAIQAVTDALYPRPNLTSSSWVTAASPGWTTFSAYGFLFNE